jgi:hypothetical protein
LREADRKLKARQTRGKLVVEIARRADSRRAAVLAGARTLQM